MVMHRVDFTNNTAMGCYGHGRDGGGAIFMNGGIARLRDVRFIGNMAYRYNAAGAVFIRGGTLWLETVQFINNTAHSYSSRGSGGVVAQSIT